MFHSHTPSFLKPFFDDKDSFGISALLSYSAAVIQSHSLVLIDDREPDLLVVDAGFCSGYPP